MSFSDARTILLIIAAGVWLIGGGILMFLHYERTGKPWWSGLTFRGASLRDFNRMEWLLFGALLGVSFGLACFAVSLGKSAP